MIKKASIKDLETLKALIQEVQDLHHQLFPKKFKPFKEAKPEIVFQNYFEDADASIFIAYSDKKEAIGYIAFRQNSYKEGPVSFAYNSIFIEHISINSVHQGKGIGKKLIQLAIKEAKKIGVECVELNVWSQNISAKGFFEKLGFKAFYEKMSLDI